MILYLDTSALVKLYVEEEGSARISMPFRFLCFDDRLRAAAEKVLNP